MRRIAVVLMLGMLGCSASDAELRAATERKARLLGEGFASGLRCELFGDLDDGIDEDPNRVPYVVHCGVSPTVCSAGRDRDHETEDDICVTIPALVTEKQAVAQHLAFAREAIRRDDVAAARQALERARTISSSDPRIEATMARISLRDGDVTTALRTAQTLRKTGTNLVDADLLLLEASVRAVDLDEEIAADVPRIPRERLEQAIESMRTGLPPDDDRHADLSALAGPD